MGVSPEVTTDSEEHVSEMIPIPAPLRRPRTLLALPLDPLLLQRDAGLGRVGGLAAHAVRDGVG
jgi:hypothetical protein